MKKSKQPKQKRNKKQEKLSQSELKELMGVNRPTYKRAKGGAIRQK
ncbi:hypothetical protein [Gracilibacillus sp. YIM 98692]|nr:hypothetical protein [Gracilibacillus sp. YIM 98692]